VSQQAVQRSNFTAEPSHLPLGVDSCPTCGQEIPPDKLEEISGKIAAREREQALAIAAQLEKEHTIEKREADAKAKADLESERQQSAIRETRMRDEVQKAIEKVYNVKLAEAEQMRAELAAQSQQQLAKAQSAQQSAEQLRANLQAEMDAVRAGNAAAIQALNAEANEREKEIRNEAMRSAESAAAERIAAIETARRESQVELTARVSEAEAGRIAAEQNQNRSTAELEELRNFNEAEVARVKEEAATELLKVRQLATAEAEARIHDTLAGQETAVAEAREKALQAEAELLRLSDQHASQMEVHLNEQREIMEKAKEEAVNSEKARAFEENQKLSTKLADLQRAWEKKTAEELGEGAEIKLLEALKKEFPDDKISRIDKGAPGADILHVVMLRGEECGTILYDSKNHNQFRHEHVAKLRADQLAARAEHAILSTHKFPQQTRQLHIQDGVILVNPARAVLIATIIRQHLQQLHTLRLSAVERESKTGALYEFVTSERCSQLLARVDQRAEGLLEQQEKEIRWHEINWRKQGEAIRAIQKAKVDLENHIHSIIGTSANDDAMSKAS
jgi:Uncharacterized protein conserved in bacteria (DUF2130)